jgi:hypothetical protein
MGMEKIPSPWRLFGAVQAISGDRMSQSGHMRADLVRPSRTQTDSKECKSSKLFHGLPFSERGSARSKPRRHASPVFRITRDRLIDPARSGQIPFHKRQVDLLNLSRRELQRQIAMSGVRLGHEKNAARETVQAMNDPRSEFSSDTRKASEPMK